jgi:uncharacterized protein (DUF1330 family)
MLISLMLAASSAAQAPSSEVCKDPVYLVVSIEHLDRTKSKAYGEALRSSGIVARNGGEYQAVGPPALVLEGEWPADRGFVVERYPCMAALQRMWYSDEYQKKLKPLRAGSGEYTVAVFNAFKRPAAVAVPAPVPAKKTMRK